ncbi:UNKNOWN [Stylonychia lemnae]|uniref:Uncharacterized protein n=1 Tax=Stylonychia lemnae TaxID=5949 RepID=A0A077ZZF5_STYLE|nr:UNKNOWN [Stylonychia lemnae]|eukprot:CDW75305.1 UNKNOWN [Stylonychia lemnae]
MDYAKNQNIEDADFERHFDESVESPLFHKHKSNLDYKQLSPVSFKDQELDPNQGSLPKKKKLYLLMRQANKNDFHDQKYAQSFGKQLSQGSSIFKLGSGATTPTHPSQPALSLQNKAMTGKNSELNTYAQKGKDQNMLMVAKQPDVDRRYSHQKINKQDLMVVRNFSEDMNYTSNKSQQNNNNNTNNHNNKKDENEIYKNLKRDDKGGIVSRSVVGSSDLMQQIIQSKQPKVLENQVTQSSSQRIKNQLFHTQQTGGQMAAMRRVSTLNPNIQGALSFPLALFAPNLSQEFDINQKQPDLQSDKSQNGSAPKQSIQAIVSTSNKQGVTAQLQKKLLNSDFIKDNFSASGDFLQHKHFSTIKSRIYTAQFEDERNLEKHSEIQNVWASQEKFLNKRVMRNCKSSCSLMRAQDIFRGKQLFLEKVSSSKELINGFSENDWYGSLREDYQVLENQKTNTWKTLWANKESETESKFNQIKTMEPKEVKTSGYTHLNSRTPLNFLCSTDPKPAWKVQLDKKTNQYKQILRANMKSNYQQARPQGQAFGMTATSINDQNFLQTTIKSYDQNIQEWIEKPVQFLQPYIEDVIDSVNIAKIDYKQFIKQLKQYCMDSDKNLSQNTVNQFFGIEGIQGQSKLNIEKNSNLGQFIKKNMRYFIQTNFGNLLSKDDPKQMNQQNQQQANSMNRSPSLTKMRTLSSNNNSTIIQHKSKPSVDIQSEKSLHIRNSDKRVSINNHINVDDNYSNNQRKDHQDDEEEYIEVNYNPKHFYK